MKKISTKTSICLFVFLNFCFSVGYLFQVESLTRGNCLAQEQKRQANSLLEKSPAGEIAIAPANLENFEKEAKMLGFVEVSQVKYIPVSNEHLADLAR